MTACDKVVIGTCSICGGQVAVPAVRQDNVEFMIATPTPTCLRCGAILADAYGPVIIMRPPTPVMIKTTDTT